MQIYNINADYPAVIAEIEGMADHGTSLGVQYGGWATQKRAASEATLNVRRVVDRMAQTLNLETGLDADVVWWVVALNQGDSIAMHAHDGDRVAVFYPQDSKDDEGGVLIFDNGDSVHSKAGMIVTFDASEAHLVTEYDGVEARYSIACNRAGVPT